MKKKQKKKINSNYICYLILFLICCIFLHYYFWTGSSYPGGDDSLFHLSNIHVIESTLDFMHLKFLPSRILPEIANNLGYGIGIFYPRLPHLVAAYITHIFSPLGANAAIGLKITHLLVLFLSGVVTFHFTDKVLSSKKAGFFAGVFYMGAAYTISDIIIRDAFAECFQFLFFPMILYGLYELFHGKKLNFYLLFVGGYIGLLSSHLVVSIFLTIAVIIYLLFHIKEVLKWDKLKSLLISSFLILICIMPSVIPMLEHKMLGNYAVFKENIMTSVGLVEACAIHPLAFFIPFWQWGKIHFFISGVVLVLIGVVCRHQKEIWKNDAQKKIFYSFSVMAILFFVMASKLAPWQYAPDFLLMIQFPWRLEIVILFTTSVLASAFFLLPEKKEQKKIDLCILLISITLGIVVISPSLKVITNEYETPRQISENGMGWSKEYLPVNTLENGKRYLYQKNEIKVTKGSATITDVINEVPKMSFYIETEEETTLELPRLFYYGYKIELTTNQETKNITYQENENGLIEITLEDSGSLTITYPGTKGYQISSEIRLVVIILITSGGIIYLVRKKVNY